MSANAVSSNRSLTARWARAVRSFVVMTGLIAAASGVSATSAQDGEYRSAAAAPAAWLAFAKDLQGRFERRLAADDDGARRTQDAMGKYHAHSQEMLVVRTWISPSGKIERLEFDGLDDADIAVNLRSLLSSVAVDAPPPDMLQPLHLRLSLRADDSSRRDR